MALHRRLLLAALLILPAALLAEPPSERLAATVTPQEEIAVIKTNLGTMAFRFYPEDAPNTVAHVKDLIRQGFYDGKTFYRVVKAIRN